MDDKEFSLQNSTDFINKLKEVDYGTFMVIVDDYGDEYTVENISMTMGGQFHPCIELKRITNPRDKWFRTAGVMVEECKEKLELYTTPWYMEECIALMGESKFFTRFVVPTMRDIDRYSKMDKNKVID